jgi:hypothetical protein
MPQIIISVRKIPGGILKRTGEQRQSIPERNNCVHATLALPLRRERIPPPAHPILPAAIIPKDQKEIFNCDSLVCRRIYVESISGMNA